MGNSLASHPHTHHHPTAPPTDHRHHPRPPPTTHLQLGGCGGEVSKGWEILWPHTHTPTTTQQHHSLTTATTHHHHPPPTWWMWWALLNRGRDGRCWRSAWACWRVGGVAWWWQCAVGDGRGWLRWSVGGVAWWWWVMVVGDGGGRTHTPTHTHTRTHTHAPTRAHGGEVGLAQL